MPMHEDVEAVVVGGGPAGLTAAILLARAGVETVLLAPPGADDPRSTALLGGSVRLLEALGVWPELRPAAGPLRVLRLVDATTGLFRAPEVSFSAEEIGLPAFGFSVGNRDLGAALRAAAERTAGLRLVAEPAAAVDPHEDAAVVRSAGGRALRARLIVGADGRNSPSRAAARIAVRSWTYPQSALVLDVEHERPHGDASTEFHTDHGPFTLAPLPGRRSGVVWVCAPTEARRRAALPDAALAEELGRQSRFILGAMRVASPRGVFPLSGQTARRMGARRIALVGEAGHVIPPIGAQGLNLGLRDAAHLAEIVQQARSQRQDIGGHAVLAAYEQARRADVTTRTLAVDALNRSLLTGLVPAHIARSAGLYALRSLGPLRRAVMREGLMPNRGAPALMLS